MPKSKTRKAVAKRMKVTKNNKILRHQMTTRHFLSAKSAGRRRSLRRSVVLVGKFAQNALKMLRG